MGIKTWPGYELLGNDCDCFPAGQTPKKIYITFSGIEKCVNVWCAAAPYPGNHSFVLDQTDNPDIWSVTSCGMDVGYRVNIPGAPPNAKSLVSMAMEGDPRSYFFGTGIDCQTFFVNRFVLGTCGQFQCGHGGTCQVFWRPAGSSPSIRGIMEKLNIEANKETFCEAWPIDADNFAVRLARQKDGTCVYIKFEHTL